MKVLVISTNVFALPPTGYSGLEVLATHLSVGLSQKGHKVTVVAPQGSNLPEPIELIPTGVMEDEEESSKRYQARLPEFDVIVDASWQRWATMISAGHDPQLPVVNWHHTSPSVYQMPAPVKFPMWVGLSRDHAERLGRAYNCQTKYVYNGIDTQFYQSSGAIRHNYLWLARWMPEKGPAEIIELAQKLKIHVDMFGDRNIIGSQAYADMCFNRADGIYARVNPGITREVTVSEYSKHRALLYWLNWAEPFGLCTVEAMACGCVPIVARRGAMPELIEDGKTGFLCDTTEDMARVIQEDRVKDINLTYMRDEVVRRFSVPVFIDAWEKLLTDVKGGLRW